jgi:UDP-3-O-[3-hydroxymyristoyl] glucosamine N-acyltransferase
MKLSDFFNKKDVVRDAEFVSLGHADSSTKGTLAYCDTIFYLEMANRNDYVTGIITNQAHIDRVRPEKGTILSVNPRNTFYELHHQLIEKNLIKLQIECGIGENCTIHPSAIVSKRSKLGNNVVISENVVIKDYVIIGDNTFIDVGVIIGSEGLLHITKDGNQFFIKHAGGVRIGNNVVILSNAVIARSIHETLFTVIGDYSIIGISSTIGHEVQVGKNCVIAGNCVVARRACLEEDVRVASSVMIREYVRIGKAAQVKAGSVVIQDIPAKQVVSGNFAIDHQKNLMNYMRSQKK